MDVFCYDGDKTQWSPFLMNIHVLAVNSASTKHCIVWENNYHCVIPLCEHKTSGSFIGTKWKQVKDIVLQDVLELYCFDLDKSAGKRKLLEHEASTL